MKHSRSIVLGLALLLAVGAHATDVRMAGGAVTFKVPDQWIDIMDTQGDPEARVFQVPDPSPSAASTLARVTVTVKQVADPGAFQQYLDGAIGKAKALTGYQPSASGQGGSDHFVYTAQEAGQQFSYYERYWLKGQHAIQLRCVRPSASQAGDAWIREFDQGCQRVAAQLNS
jgi:hypothetical protein